MRLIALESMDYTIRDQLVELREGAPLIVDDEVGSILIDQRFAREASEADDAEPDSTPQPDKAAATADADDDAAEADAGAAAASKPKKAAGKRSKKK